MTAATDAVELATLAAQAAASKLATDVVVPRAQEPLGNR